MNTIESWLEHPLVARLEWCLVHSVWEIAAVALIAVAVLRIFRKGSAQGRYLAACVALVVMAALPVVTLAWVSRLPAAAEVSIPGATLRPGIIVPIGNGPDLAGAAQEPVKEPPIIRVKPLHVPAQPGPSEQLEPWLPLLVAAWGLGVVFLSIRLLGGWPLIQKLTRRATRTVEGPWISDAGQALPMVEQVEGRYKTTPGEVLIDGGFAQHDQIEALEAPEKGCTVYAPVPASKGSESGPVCCQAVGGSDCMTAPPSGLAEGRWDSPHTRGLCPPAIHCRPVGAEVQVHPVALLQSR